MALNLFPDSMLKEQELSLDSIASKLFYFYIQLQVYHWQTTMYREHKILGDLYEFIDDRRDNIVENIMGYTGTRPRMIRIPSIEEYSMGCAMFIVENISQFASQLKAYAERSSMLGVSAISDEISGECAKVKYLLTLGGGKDF